MSFLVCESQTNLVEHNKRNPNPKFKSNRIKRHDAMTLNVVKKPYQISSPITLTWWLFLHALGKWASRIETGSNSYCYALRMREPLNLHTKIMKMNLYWNPPALSPSNFIVRGVECEKQNPFLCEFRAQFFRDGRSWSPCQFWRENILIFTMLARWQHF